MRDLAGLAVELGLLRRRAAKGLRKPQVSLQDLARRVGLPRSTVHAYVTGKTLPPADVLDMIVIGLGADEVEQRAWAEAWHRVYDRVERERRTGKRPGSPDVRGTGQAAARGVPVPRQLPPHVAGFTGRERELAALDESLTSAQAENTVSIGLVSGPAGVGKTALAVHWAHQIRDRFPDGQLYVNLRGYDSGPPMAAEQALDGFLRALNVPAERIPATVDDRAGLFRSLLDNRRILVLLDNANAADQVRPLLPGSPSCLAVVTSRSRLSGLVARDGARRLNLDPLDAAEAIALLRHVIGAVRADAEPGATAELARQCACLPLALRIAAERAATHAHLTLADLTSDLANEPARLDLLSADEDITALRSVFSWSYRGLPPDAARMFRLLGLHAGPDIGIPAAAALAGTDPNTVQTLLEDLTSVHLLEEIAPRRYRFHDLLRIYAAERAAAEEGDAEREIAVRRMLRWYLRTSRAAGRILIPRRRSPLGPPQGDDAPAFTTHEEALNWCDTELANLIAATRQAAEAGEHVIAWKLPHTLWQYFMLRKHWSDWIAATQIGLGSARHINDRYGEAWMLTCLGGAHWDLRRSEPAVDYLEQAMAIWRKTDERWGQGITLLPLGLAYHDLRRHAQAVDCLQSSLEFIREVGDRGAEGVALIGLGNACRELRRFDEATDYYEEALHHFRQIDNRFGEGWTLHEIGKIYRSRRKLVEAIDHFQKSLVVRRATGERLSEAHTLTDLGDAQHEAHHLGAARDSWGQALAIFEDLEDSKANEVRARLAGT